MLSPDYCNYFYPISVDIKKIVSTPQKTLPFNSVMLEIFRKHKWI